MVKAAVLALGLLLVGCATSQPEREARAEQIFHQCAAETDTRGATITSMVVQPNGRVSYKWKIDGGGSNALAQMPKMETCLRAKGDTVGGFQSSLATAKEYHRSIPAKDRVRSAYFIAVPPPNGPLKEAPAKVTTFNLDSPVWFYANFWNSGQDHKMKLSWTRPDGILELQQDVAVKEATGRSTWRVALLPAERVRHSGTWTLEVYSDDEFMGRFTFTVVPGAVEKPAPPNTEAPKAVAVPLLENQP